MHPSPHPIGYHWGNCQMLPRDILASLTDNCQAQRSGPWVNLRQGEAEAGEWVPQVSTGTPSVLWKPATTRWRQLHTLPHFLPQTHSIPSSSCFRLTFVLNAIFSLIFFPPDFSLCQHAMWGPLLAFSCFNGSVILPQRRGVSKLHVAISEMWVSR